MSRPNTEPHWLAIAAALAALIIIAAVIVGVLAGPIK